ncbi:MAG: DUF1566 domain-containing protein, partial [Thermodesulfovibrionales bacterium]
MVKKTFLVVLFIMLGISLSFAQPAQVPKTGQTTSYATGDDGDLKRGVAWPSPRFTDNGNGTITDNLTGLVWLKDANCANAVRTWSQALSDVNELNTSGTMNGNNCGDTSNGGSHQTDWRLPNRKELRSLIDYSQYRPALPSGHPFSNVQSNYYWSSTTYAGDTVNAWIVDMWFGYVDAYYKTNFLYVWPVRAGQVGNLYNLVISKSGTGSGTVTSSDGGINCGADCSEQYASGTTVTLTATPDSGSTFAGWSGDCTDIGNNQAQVTMDANKSCTATFNL